MSPRKSKLHRKKHKGSSYNEKRSVKIKFQRILHNAALKFKCSKSSLKSLVLSIPRLSLFPQCHYQHFSLNGVDRILTRPIVVSVYDGISSGRVAMDRIGILPQRYYSSEIDKGCLALQRFHFGDDITQIGDVTQLSYAQLEEMGRVSLIFGGSPCHQISGANANRAGLVGDKTSLNLFMQFVKLLKFFKKLAFVQNRQKTFFWFFENVATMSNMDKKFISKHLGCKPIVLCSSMFTAMKRKRLFWTNIPRIQTYQEFVDQKSWNKGSIGNPGPNLVLQDYLIGSGRKANITTLPTFTSNPANLVKKGVMPVSDSIEGDSRIYLSEIEQLFGFPISYTSGPDNPLSVRRKMLANSWDIHTISHILKPLIHEFMLPHSI